MQGWFPNDATLETTINALRGAGYVWADASLPKDPTDPAPGEDASAPTAQDHQQMRTLTAGMAGYAGAAPAGAEYPCARHPNPGPGARRRGDPDHV